MARLARLLLLVFSLAAFGAGAAVAADFDLPGLGADSQAYLDGLIKRHPAGGTPQLRTAAEQQAASGAAAQGLRGAGRGTRGAHLARRSDAEAMARSR